MRLENSRDEWQCTDWTEDNIEADITLPIIETLVFPNSFNSYAGTSRIRSSGRVIMKLTRNSIRRVLFRVRGSRAPPRQHRPQSAGSTQTITSKEKQIHESSRAYRG